MHGNTNVPLVVGFGSFHTFGISFLGGPELPDLWQLAFQHQGCPSRFQGFKAKVFLGLGFRGLGC